MPMRISPPLRQAQLGETLRELRAARGLKLDEVATRLRCSRGKVSNVENGNSLVTPGYVRDALALYGADEPTTVRCIQLITDARRTRVVEALQQGSGCLCGV
jgi:transcriptional regulator with XRE-family HTH domain